MGGTAEQQRRMTFGAEALGLVEDQPEQYRPGFREWLDANRHVWARFEEEALKVWHKGRRHYSARTIIEFLRHETACAELDGPFKLNDHATPDLARLFIARHPQCAELFETRRRAA
jgi:hypothetical protein